MRLRAFSIMSFAIITLSACGLDTNQPDQFEDKSKTKAAEREREADATRASSETKGELDCTGITLHGSHLTCDEDDVAARDQKKPDSKDSEKDDDTSKDETNDAPSDDGANDSSDDDDTPAQPAKPEGDPNIVVFRIKAGTGNGGWNTQAEMIQAKIGQTIRVYNDDTIVHRLHTSGRPCPHGINIPVGGSRDCVVSQTFDSTNSNAVYDHIAGPSSKIWIRTTN